MEFFDVDTLDTCRDLWRAAVPQESLFDLWEVQECFWRAYGGEPLFLVAREGVEICGLLALARTDLTGGWGCFPGETWMGKTWLERNRIVATDREVVRGLLERCPRDTHLRYLVSNDFIDGMVSHDETGYLFLPEQWGYCAENFWASFSGKSRKRIWKEIDALTQRGVEICRSEVKDVETLIALNLEAFAERSYFSDERFLCGFRDLVAWLGAQGYLEVTTVRIEDCVAAVDVSAVYQNACTVLAGGTHPEFPGVAKLINAAHIEWACEQTYTEVDFLCGDFGWKERFHLTARPLYQYESSPRCMTLDALDEAGSSYAE